MQFNLVLVATCPRPSHDMVGVCRPSVLTAVGGANTVNGAMPPESLITLMDSSGHVKKRAGIEKSKPGVLLKKKSLKRL